MRILQWHFFGCCKDFIIDKTSYKVRLLLRQWNYKNDCASKLQRLIGCRISCATLILWRSLFLLWTNLKLYSKRSLAGKVYRVVCCSFFLEYRYCKSIKEFWYISATWHTTPVGPVEMVCYSWNYWNKSLDARVNMMIVRTCLHTNLELQLLR